MSGHIGSITQVHLRARLVQVDHQGFGCWTANSGELARGVTWASPLAVVTWGFRHPVDDKRFNRVPPIDLAGLCRC